MLETPVLARKRIRKALYATEETNLDEEARRVNEDSQVAEFAKDTKRGTFDAFAKDEVDVVATVVEACTTRDDKVLIAKEIDSWTQDDANDPAVEVLCGPFLQAEDVSCTQLQHDEMGESSVTRMHAKVRGGVFYHVNAP